MKILTAIICILCFIPWQKNNEHKVLSSNSELQINCTVDLDTVRIRLNESQSLALSYEIGQDGEALVDYQVVEAGPDDKYSILDLRDMQKNIYPSNAAVSVNFIGFKKSVVNVELLERRINLNDTSDSSTDTYLCECNSSEEDVTNDCELNSYQGAHSCDGNFCKGCSLVVIWGENRLDREEFDSGLIYLSENN